MKITLILREGLESRFIASEICKHQKNVQVIIESGKTAKIKKLKRIFVPKKWYLWPKRFIDLLVLQMYEMSFNKYILKKIGNPKLTDFTTIDDVNEKKCLQAVLPFDPDIVIIFGTAIIKENFLTKVKKPIFNIHTGILPKYRNVHSEFWAYLNNDNQNIGVTIIHVDKGIDSGAIALQAKVTYKKSDTLFSLRLQTFKLITPLLNTLLTYQKKRKVPKIKQEITSATYYPTPTAFQILKCFYKEWVSAATR